MWKHARAEVQKQWTLKQRNKLVKRIKIHQSQWPFWTCWSKILFPKRSAKMIDSREKHKNCKGAESTQPSDFDWCSRKTQYPKTFWHHRSCVIRNSWLSSHGHLLAIPMRVLPLLSPLKQPSSIWYTWRKIQSEKEGGHDNRLSTSHTASVTYLFQNKVVFVLKIMQIFKEPLLSGPPLLRGHLPVPQRLPLNEGSTYCTMFICW